ncbi:uncharacterized protein YecE (DUF72 family) [Scopulibacillus daqui]|uniref:Uncharacterized protein YecE (DUF72 family) n=1 Tax=Scopulibacillus daqui TaxID=1469162 RepID=A0ABS2Q3Z0_9BACL|nr:uncharacterized protein YecE (DUF72 family) [Scopulibacillus daqui]
MNLRMEVPHHSRERKKRLLLLKSKGLCLGECMLNQSLKYRSMVLKGRFEAVIYIGLTGWGDHDSLYEEPITKATKLEMYASHFPVVECDSSFYAILPENSYVKWIKETPETFSFIVKAYQGMTGHAQHDIPYKTIGDMFEAYIASIQPLIEADKLTAVLFQYPPWFNCTKDHIALLRYTRHKMGDIPVVLEFRNQSWFKGPMKKKTLAFMKEEGWIHSICDEPQAGEGSVPIVLESTNSDKTIVRMHGRNIAGWENKGQPNWRDVRYLYRYNYQELKEWQERLQVLQKKTKDIYVIFNNNSGGDAADNAKMLMTLLDIDYEGLAPKQLNLF